MFLKPNYTLTHFAGADLPLDGATPFAFVAALTGKGPFNGTVVGYKEFALKDRDMQVEFSILIVPPNLSEHVGDIKNGQGKIYRKIRREINKATSTLITMILQEAADEAKRKDDRRE